MDAPTLISTEQTRRLDAAVLSAERAAVDRLSIFTAVYAKNEAEQLLEGLSEHYVARAQEQARAIATLDSPSRHARIARDFGERADAPASLRGLVHELPPLLAGAIRARLPSYYRSLLPDATIVEGSAALDAWAERLMREATR